MRSIPQRRHVVRSWSSPCHLKWVEMRYTALCWFLQQTILQHLCIGYREEENGSIKFQCIQYIQTAILTTWSLLESCHSHHVALESAVCICHHQPTPGHVQHHLGVDPSQQSRAMAMAMAQVGKKKSEVDCPLKIECFPNIQWRSMKINEDQWSIMESPFQVTEWVQNETTWNDLGPVPSSQCPTSNVAPCAWPPGHAELLRWRFKKVQEGWSTKMILKNIEKH